MSGPMPRPDKFAARLAALVTLMLILAVAFMEPSGWVAYTGQIILLMTLGWMFMVFAFYDTKHWGKVLRKEQKK